MNQFSKIVLSSIITLLLLPAVQAEQTFPIEPEGEWYVLDAADVFDDQTEQEFSLELAEKVLKNQLKDKSAQEKLVSDWIAEVKL